MRLLLLLVFSCSVLLSKTQVTDSVNSDTPDFPDYDLEEVVVTAQAAPGSSSQAIQQFRVIGREQIVKMGANNLNDVLRNSLNVRLSQDLILGSGLSLQGMSGQNVKIMLDGVPLIGRQNGQLDLSQINLNNIERIEIIEGPMSVNFGTDALAGTINLISKEIPDDQISVATNAYLESVGVYNFDGNASLSRGKQQVSLNGGRYFFGGYSANDSGRSKTWKPREQVFGGWKYQTALSSAKLSVEGSYFIELITNRGDLRPPYFENAFDDEYRTRRIDHRLSFRSGTQKVVSFKGVAAFNDYRRHKNTWFKDLTTLASVPTGPEDQDSSRFFSGMSRGTLSFSPKQGKLSAQAGYDGNFERGTGKRIQNKVQDQMDVAAFGLLRYQVAEQVKIQAGLRAGWNSRYQSPLTPSLNVWAEPRPNFIVRASYARGFRAPSLKELFLDFNDINHNLTGNPNLNAEYSHNFALNFNYKKLWGQSLMKLKMGFWYNDLRDQIALALVDVGDLLYSYTNVGRFRSVGGKIEGDFLFKDLRLKPGLSLNAVSNDFETNTTEISDFAWSPEANLNVEGKLPFTSIQYAIYYKWTGRLPQVALNSNGEAEQFYIAAFHMLDFSLSRQFWKDKIQLTLGAKNLMNVQNILNSGGSGGVHSGAGSAVPVSWGRSVFAKLNFRIL